MKQLTFSNVFIAVVVLGLFVGLYFPLYALPVHAAGLATSNTGGVSGTLLQNIVQFTNGVLIPFFLALAFFIFLWGVARYFVISADNEQARESGRQLAVYGVAAIVLLIIFWGLVNLLASSIGLQGKTLNNTNVPVGVRAP